MKKKIKLSLPKPVLFLIPVLVVGGVLFVLSRGKKKTTESTSPPAATQSIKKPGGFTDDIETLEAKIARAPHDRRLLLQLAQAYTAQGMPDLAYLTYRKVIKLAPNSPEASVARNFLSQQEQVALNAWKSGPGSNFQRISQLGYSDLTIQLRTITQKVEKKQEEAKKLGEQVKEEEAQAKTEATQRVQEKKKEEEQQQPGLYILTPITQTNTTK